MDITSRTTRVSKAMIMDNAVADILAITQKHFAKAGCQNEIHHDWTYDRKQDEDKEYRQVK